MDDVRQATATVSAATDRDHPVWDVYDELRTARLTVKYYAAIRKRLETRVIAMEVIIASTASGSVIAGLAFWSASGAGRIVWQALAIVSAVLAVAKPMLRWSDKVQRLDELIVQYRGIDHELRKLEVAVRQAGAYGPALQQQFAAVLERKSELVLKEGTDPIDDKLRRHCREQVDKELPQSHFFVPAR